MEIIDKDRSRTTHVHTTTQLTALQAKEVFSQGSVEKNRLVIQLSESRK